MHPRDVSRDAHVKPESIPRVLSELSDLEWIRILSSPHVRTYERTNDTNERNGHSSSTDGGQEELIPKPKAASRRPKSAPLNSQLVIARYCELWKSRYKAAKSPHVPPKDIGQINTQVTKPLGAEKTIEMLEAYFKMPDQWFVTKRHDIPTFIANMNSVEHFLQTGQILTRKDTKRLEEKVNTQNLMDMVDEGKI